MRFSFLFVCLLGCVPAHGAKVGCLAELIRLVYSDQSLGVYWLEGSTPDQVPELRVSVDSLIHHGVAQILGETGLSEVDITPPRLFFQEEFYHPHTLAKPKELPEIRGADIRYMKTSHRASSFYVVVSVQPGKRGPYPFDIAYRVSLIGRSEVVPVAFEGKAIHIVPQLRIGLFVPPPPADFDRQIVPYQELTHRRPPTLKVADLLRTEPRLREQGFQFDESLGLPPPFGWGAASLLVWESERRRLPQVLWKLKAFAFRPSMVQPLQDEGRFYWVLSGYVDSRHRPAIREMKGVVQVMSARYEPTSSDD